MSGSSLFVPLSYMVDQMMVALPPKKFMNAEIVPEPDVSGLRAGEAILYCPGCGWTHEAVACKPECPKCLDHLHVWRVE